MRQRTQRKYRQDSFSDLETLSFFIQWNQFNPPPLLKQILTSLMSIMLHNRHNKCAGHTVTTA